MSTQDQAQPQQRRTLTARPGWKPNASGARPFVAKGHDAILKRMQDNGGRISVTAMGDGARTAGKMIARDKFTITLKTDEGREITFYKHAIESFESI